MRRLFIPLMAILLAASVVTARAPHAFADPRDFHMTNANASLSVVALYIDVSGPGDYSTELLGGATVAPGEGGTVRFDQTDAGQCVYDLMAQYDDGSTREFTGLDLCSTVEVTIS
jgi:hypothetical protein